MKSKEGLELVEKRVSFVMNASGICFLLSLIMIFSSLLFWIWYDGWVAFKVFLTGLVLWFISRFINKVTKMALENIKELSEKDKEKTDKPKKSRFQQRLEEMQQKQNNA